MNKENFNLNNKEDKESFKKLLDYLMGYNQLETKWFYDIHITQDKRDNTTNVEWIKVYFDEEERDSFKLVHSWEFIMEEVQFPDGHYDFVFPQEKEHILKEWHEKHPEWVLTSYGTWTNVEENRKFRLEYFDKLDKYELDRLYTIRECDKGKASLKSIIYYNDEEKLVLRRTDYLIIDTGMLEVFQRSDCCDSMNIEFKKGDNYLGGYISLVTSGDKLNEGIKTTLPFYVDDIHTFECPTIRFMTNEGFMLQQVQLETHS